ncbi:DUF6238 family protein [Yinghuangia aomiensis]|uniref:DUF6238 family protein n=1 Tax=Yinghuangia aomiensis TaxID=676205 RepID=A0ABP9GTR2_9ACTN
MTDPHNTDFLAVAGTGIDAARILTLPDLTPDQARPALDSVHDVLAKAHQLLDEHSRPAAPAVRITPDCGPHLDAGVVYLWLCLNEVHKAFHHTARPGDWSPAAGGDHPLLRDLAACHRGLPHGDPDLRICARTHEIAARMRRRTTPADLRTPATGLIRHARPGQAGAAA